MGGSSLVGNAGLIQPDIFSNEKGLFRLTSVPYTVGTKITSITPIGLEEVLLTKDKGLVYGRSQVTPDNRIDFSFEYVSYEAGCTTIAQIAKDDDGWLYFAGYEDVYRFRDRYFEPIVTHGDKNDWLFTYREQITKSQKEQCVTFYLPEGCVIFDMQSNGTQFAFYPPRVLLQGLPAYYEWREVKLEEQPGQMNYGWRQVAFKQTSGTASTQFFKFYTRLQGGTVVATTTGQAFMQFSNPATLVFYYDDNGTAIIPQIDTGNFYPSGHPSFDTIWEKFVIDTTKDVATTGTLDVQVYKDSSLLKTVSGLDKTAPRLEIWSRADEPRVANAWRFSWNTNATPETMQVGSGAKQFQINSLDFYGAIQPYESPSQSGTRIQMPPSNTVAGITEVILNKTPQTFTWDVPFNNTYTGSEGVVPSYRILMESAHPLSGGVQDTTVDNLVFISAKTLTTFTAYADSDSVLFKFKAEEV